MSSSGGEALRFSANLSMLFGEMPFLDRFDAASRSGFRGVEYVSPYEYEPAVISERLKAHGLEQVLFNLPAGNWSAGERGIGALPDRKEEFRKGVATAIGHARALGCTRVNCLAGIAPGGVARSLLEDTLVENLAYAAREMKAAGICLLLEAINLRDIPGFVVSTTAEALAILDRVGSDNLYLQYDIYHMQIMEGDLAMTIEANLDRIAHFQVADNPGRHEPGTGEINYRFLFGLLRRLGYGGWIGAEYKPRGETAAGLSWMAAAGA